MKLSLLLCITAVLFVLSGAEDKVPVVEKGKEDTPAVESGKEDKGVEKGNEDKGVEKGNEDKENEGKPGLAGGLFGGVEKIKKTLQEIVNSKKNSTKPSFATVRKFPSSQAKKSKSKEHKSKGHKSHHKDASRRGKAVRGYSKFQNKKLFNDEKYKEYDSNKNSGHQSAHDSAGRAGRERFRASEYPGSYGGFRPHFLPGLI